MGKQDDVMAILKLYELRRDGEMRAARQWYFTDFAPKNVMDIVALFQGGERVSAYFRMVTSYWDTAASFVINGGIDQKLFLDANTEHVFIYAKIADFLPEVREIFRDPDYLIHLENLVKSLPDFEAKIASRKRLFKLWTKTPESEPPA
ncbi:MAG: hypothetical protein ABJB40_12525 [Acidobacteriota bacterium]